MGNLTLDKKMIEYMKKGSRYFYLFRRYLELLEKEFEHEDLAERLRVLAKNGLKVSTGLSFQEWHKIIDPWESALNNLTPADEAGSYTKFVSQISKWLNLFEKMLAYVNQAPIEARKLSNTEETDKDVREIFEDKGKKLLTGIIQWIKELAAESQAPGTKQQATGLKPSVQFSSAVADGVLVINNVSKSYGALQAVKNISFAIKKSEVFGLLGPNGAGKTSLIESIEGIRTPDSGSITILNKNYQQDKKFIKEHIGIQLQTTGFYQELTVKELLVLYASFYTHHTKIDDLLKRLNLQDKKTTLVKNLSGGMYQRLSLGVALLNDPDLLFLDEPTTGLDPNARHLIWDIVRDVQAKGTTIFLTTHYMEEAEALCSRVAIMEQGEIIAMNTPANLIKEHIGEKTIVADFVEPIDLELVKKIANVEKFWISNTQLTMTTTDPHQTFISLFKLPVKTRDIQFRQGNLEDVFLKLTNRRLMV